MLLSLNSRLSGWRRRMERAARGGGAGEDGGSEDGGDDGDNGRIAGFNIKVRFVRPDVWQKRWSSELVFSSLQNTRVC